MRSDHHQASLVDKQVPTGVHESGGIGELFLNDKIVTQSFYPNYPVVSRDKKKVAHGALAAKCSQPRSVIGFSFSSRLNRAVVMDKETEVHCFAANAV